jgi:hypothetical protein
MIFKLNFLEFYILGEFRLLISPVDGNEIFTIEISINAWQDTR